VLRESQEKLDAFSSLDVRRRFTSKARWDKHILDKKTDQTEKSVQADLFDSESAQNGVNELT
jgi:hypothetical protein